MTFLLFLREQEPPEPEQRAPKGSATRQRTYVYNRPIRKRQISIPITARTLIQKKIPIKAGTAIIIELPVKSRTVSHQSIPLGAKTLMRQSIAIVGDTYTNKLLQIITLMLLCELVELTANV